MLSEADSRIVLKEAFEAAGYQICEDILWGDVRLDGLDPEAKVGYEYLSSTDIKSLDSLHQAGLRLFVIDEKRVPDADTLIEAVSQFLEQLDR